MSILAAAKNQRPREMREPRDVTSYPLTPGQYYDEIGRSSRLDGESRLLFAVLEDAIRCYTMASRSTRRSDQRAFEEVKEWVNTRGDHDLFSFDSICRVFDLEPDHLRMQLNSIEVSKIRRHRFRTVGRRITLSVRE